MTWTSLKSLGVRALWIIAVSLAPPGALSAAPPEATGPAAADARPLVRIAELDIDPAQIAAYKALLAEEVEASVRLEPGVLMLNAVSIDENPAHIRLLEVYANRAAYEAHLRSPQFMKYKTLTAPMVRSLKLMPTTPVMLCAKSGISETGSAHCM